MSNNSTNPGSLSGLNGNGNLTGGTSPNNKPPKNTNGTDTGGADGNTSIPTTGETNAENVTDVTSGEAKAAGQMNVADYAGQLVTDPSKGFAQDDPSTPDVNESELLSDHVPNIDENAEGTNIDKSNYQNNQDVNASATNAEAAPDVQQVDPRQANTYDAAQTQENVAQNGQATGQHGTVSDQSLVDANDAQLDMKGSATGVNEDGSINYTGEALNDYAHQNLSNVIDTSTPAGKALAEQLGDGNYVDSKATLKGQLDTLQSEFQDANGNPKIPAWAAGTARGVAKIAAFSGLSGTAATAAMSQAIMEASIPVAQQDAQFFQTMTMQNLSNKQQATINKANVLSKFDLTNVDNRMAAAVQNAQAFLQMDMKNLDNDQQAELLNTQSRVQSILEDANSKNAERLFTAQSQNDMDKFYDNLNTSIGQFNTTQHNAMSQFNAQNSTDVSKFNADMENNRDQFYKSMQYNVDVANAKWRQTVTLTENQQQFEAASTDVKNMVDLSNEQLNQLWDRADSLLDYAWKSSENEADRKSALAIAKFQASAASKAADQAGMGKMFGGIVGTVTSKFLDSDFASDIGKSLTGLFS